MVCWLKKGIMCTVAKPVLLIILPTSIHGVYRCIRMQVVYRALNKLWTFFCETLYISICRPWCQPVSGQCAVLALSYVRAVASPEDCRRKCASREVCKFYSWTGVSGAFQYHCHLFSSCPTLRFPVGPWISGPANYPANCQIIVASNLLRIS